MRRRRWPSTLLALLVTAAVSAAVAAPSPLPAPTDDLRALTGEWLYVEDRTEGRPDEERGPPISPRFTLRLDADALVMPRSGREDRYPLDGSVSERPGTGSVSRYSASWKDGEFELRTEIVRLADGAVTTLILKGLRPTAEGLMVHVAIGSPPQRESWALYRHPADIALPTPATGAADDLSWLAGAWVGTSGTSTTEERWGPPRGGSLLGTSRTIKRGSMTAFEFLRIVDRDGGLVYVAQPNGGAPTEFVLTELGPERAVFDNPRHDFPQRIVYARDGERLSASIGFLHGGRPRRFEFERERD